MRSRNCSRPSRRSIRLQNYDYSLAGAYFVTVCTQDRALLLGSVSDGDVDLTDAGRMVVSEWEALVERFPHVDLDAFVAMPNHIHGILLLKDFELSADQIKARADRSFPGIGDIVGAFKSRTTVLYARGVRDNGWPAFHGRLWQRNYFEHIIRDEVSLQKLREYIVNNPLRWELDSENPRALSSPLVNPWDH